MQGTGSSKSFTITVEAPMPTLKAITNSLLVLVCMIGMSHRSL